MDILPRSGLPPRENFFNLQGAGIFPCELASGEGFAEAASVTTPQLSETMRPLHQQQLLRHLRAYPRDICDRTRLGCSANPRLQMIDASPSQLPDLNGTEHWGCRGCCAERILEPLLDFWHLIMRA